MRLKLLPAFAIAFASVLFLAATLAARPARPYTIVCPYDGLLMRYSHQVGYGARAVCWYSHRTLATLHSAYVPCGN